MDKTADASSSGVGRTGPSKLPPPRPPPRRGIPPGGTVSPEKMKEVQAAGSNQQYAQWKATVPHKGQVNPQDKVGKEAGNTAQAVKPELLRQESPPKSPISKASGAASAASQVRPKSPPQRSGSPPVAKGVNTATSPPVKTSSSPVAKGTSAAASPPVTKGTSAAANVVPPLLRQKSGPPPPYRPPPVATRQRSLVTPDTQYDGEISKIANVVGAEIDRIKGNFDDTRHMIGFLGDNIGLLDQAYQTCKTALEELHGNSEELKAGKKALANKHLDTLVQCIQAVDNWGENPAVKSMAKEEFGKVISKVGNDLKEVAPKEWKQTVKELNKRIETNKRIRPRLS